MADVSVAVPEQIQIAIILPPALTKKLDEFVRLGAGESRESLIWLALDQFVVTTEQRLERKNRGLTSHPQAEADSLQREDSFQRLGEIASRTSALTDEQIDETAHEAVNAVRREQHPKAR